VLKLLWSQPSTLQPPILQVGVLYKSNGAARDRCREVPIMHKPQVLAERSNSL
jgi:hypothetical protein